MRRTPNVLEAAPMAGEQTDSILSELGYEPPEITVLRENGTVWSEAAVYRDS